MVNPMKELIIDKTMIIEKHKPKKLKDGILITGLPGIGLIGQVVGRYLVEVFEQVVDRHRNQLVVAFQCRQRVVDVRLVVFGVVDLHCPRIDMRLKGVVSIFKIR